MDLGGLPAGLCSPSLPAGPECSHSLRFGQGPIFVELSKHLYSEMFHLVSFWRGSRGVQSSIACPELLGSVLGCKNIPGFWGPVRQQVLLAHLAAWLLQAPVGAFAFPATAVSGCWFLFFGFFSFSCLWHEVRVNALTPRAGQSVNHYCTPEISFWLAASPCSKYDLSFLQWLQRGSLGVRVL